MIKEWYNGYSWNGETSLYNPYSILSLFSKGIFRNYWFETGTPSFLMDFIKNNEKDANILFNPNTVISGDFPNFKLDNIDFTTLLLQTGYLTIKSENIIVGELPTYELAIPNREVNESLFTYIISEFSNEKNSADISKLANKILESIINLDNGSLQDAFDILIANVPAILYNKIKKDIREANYHLWFLSWFRLMGFFVIAENPSSKGFADIVLKKDNLVIICELKYGINKPLKDLAKDAIMQIKDKEYYKPYLDYNVILLGIAFGYREIKSYIEPLK